jgi:hypothetical protein
VHADHAILIPAIGPGLVLGALLLVAGATLTWQRASEGWFQPPDHAKAMPIMVSSMVAGMMAGLWGGILGMGLLGDKGGPSLWHGTALGIEVGLLAGLLTGAPGGIAAALEGAMAGLMGGLMSPMLVQMAPESSGQFLSLILLIWSWVGAGAGHLLLPDLPKRWLVFGAGFLSALIMGVWGAPWMAGG